jgi:uncharacterized protein YjbJ (UPF0337 family)
VGIGRAAGGDRRNRPNEELSAVSFADKVQNKIDSLKGRAKRRTGEATQNRDLRSEGRRQRSSAELRDAGEKVKDAFRH